MVDVYGDDRSGSRDSQTAVAAEAFVPIGKRFDVTSEVVYARSNTREAVDGYQLSPFTERYGRLEAFAYYVQAGLWVLGSRDVIGLPNLSKPVHVDLDKAPRPRLHGLQLLVKFEQLRARYEGASRGGKADAVNADGVVAVNACSFGATYWATRHLRGSVNWVIDTFPDRAADRLRALHEIQARAGLQF
jgi:hypothetical protein